jgi:hypothetical protein
MKREVLGAVVAVLMATGCGVAEGTVMDQPADETATGTGLTFEQFKSRHVFVEPETGFFIADGDTPFFSEKQLREFYELNVRDGQLIVNRVGSADDKWTATQRKNLSYCVSNTFGTRKAQVVQLMAAAAASWEAVADVKFVYVPAQDGSCTASNQNVLFDVRPSTSGSYLARAFFPSTGRSGRNVIIDNSSFGDPSVSAEGVVRHELGHVLGFRHEHTRPEAGTCFEDNAWRALTSYDRASIMHYPHCNGVGDWSNKPLSALDKQGVAALYGPPSGSSPSPSPAPSTGGATTETFSGSVAASANKNFGPFVAVAGSTLTVALSGSGDADLYVRFGATPSASKFDCRPYLDGSAETCTLTVPATATSAYVLVNGYTASTFSLSVTYAKATGSTAPATTGTPKAVTTSGSLGAGQQVQWNPIAVVPGTQFSVTMTGTGDPDLYVRFGAQATTTLFDCRPWVTGASEQCTLTVPAGVTSAYVMVSGYTAATYTLDMDYVAP